MGKRLHPEIKPYYKDACLPRSLLTPDRRTKNKLVRLLTLTQNEELISVLFLPFSRPVAKLFVSIPLIWYRSCLRFAVGKTKEMKKKVVIKAIGEI